MRLLGVYLGDIYCLHVANFAHYPQRPLEAKIYILVIITICKIDKIWKEYFYHIPNQVYVPGMFEIP